MSAGAIFFCVMRDEFDPMKSDKLASSRTMNDQNRFQIENKNMFEVRIWLSMVFDDYLGGGGSYA